VFVYLGGGEYPVTSATGIWYGISVSIIEWWGTMQLVVSFCALILQVLYIFWNDL
jgi:hypothetical protein